MEIKQTLVFIVLLSSVVFLLSFNSSQSNIQLYEQWKLKLGVTFTGDEDSYRLKVFEENLAKINSHNSKVGKTHTEALNQFIFLTKQEFKANYLSSFTIPKIQKIIEAPSIPTVDWVSAGAVTPVMSEGSCDGSYAFSAVGAMQGLSMIVYKKRTILSAQQIVDCSRSFGNSGCEDGDVTSTFEYVKSKGLNYESAYPWIGADYGCQGSGGPFRIEGYTSITPGDCDSLVYALQVKPVSVVVDGNNFQFYSSGIFYNCETDLSLAVTLVGMNDRWWTLKNCWGTMWGENGFIRIGQGNICGVCFSASYPHPIQQ